MEPLTDKPLTRQSKGERWPHMLWIGAVVVVLGAGLLFGGGGLDGWALIVLGAMMVQAGLIGAAVRDRR